MIPYTHFNSKSETKSIGGMQWSLKERNYSLQKFWVLCTSLSNVMLDSDFFSKRDPTHIESNETGSILLFNFCGSIGQILSFMIRKWYWSACRISVFKGRVWCSKGVFGNLQNVKIFTTLHFTLVWFRLQNAKCKNFCNSSFPTCSCYS